MEITKTNQQQVMDYLNKNYKFRFNVVKNQIEIFDSKTETFERLVRKKINTISVEIKKSGLNTSAVELEELLYSDFIPNVNPIHEYFTNLQPNNDNVDYIAQLCNTVTVGNPQKWNEYFTKWMVAVVANAMTDKGCQNHACLVLTGGQGLFKTTWLDNLAPKKLSSYIYTGKIDPNSKDALIYIAEFLFINIDDQLTQLNKQQESELKDLITTPSVKYRKPYDQYVTEYPHLASFMASENDWYFLSNTIKSRRFLPFEVLRIDIDAAKKIDMDKVWAQAYALFKSGFAYFFNEAEIHELLEINKDYEFQQLIKFKINICKKLEEMNK